MSTNSGASISSRTVDTAVSICRNRFNRIDADCLPARQLCRCGGRSSVTEALFLLYGTKPVNRVGVRAGVRRHRRPRSSRAVVTEIRLPEVRIGPVDPVSQGPWAGYLYTSPSFTWDPVGARLLVAHGDEDVVIGGGHRNRRGVVEHALAGTVDLRNRDQTNERPQPRRSVPPRGHPHRGTDRRRRRLDGHHQARRSEDHRHHHMGDGGPNR